MAIEVRNRALEGMKTFIKRPDLFVKQVLQANPSKWQSEGLNRIATKNRLVVRSGHGVGKTAFESWVSWWFLFTRPNARIPTTAPTQRQLHDVLWAEMSKWGERSPILKEAFEVYKTRITNKAKPEQWFITARASNRPENLAGFHSEHLLFIVDEASGIGDEIFDTIEGALTERDNKLLMCGNPTKTTGTFYHAFHKDRSLYSTMTVSCLDSPRQPEVMQAYAQRMAKKYGMDSDVYRVRVLGLFPRSEPDMFIALDIVEAAIMREVWERNDDGSYTVPLDAQLEIGVDVARFGDDETAIAVRMGDRLLKIRRFQKQGTMETVGYLVVTARDIMQEYGLRRCKVKIDDDGVGGGVTDRLREMKSLGELDGFDIVDCHNGHTANDSEHYANWGTEAWAYLRDKLVEGTIELTEEEDLIAQLTTRKYTMTSKGQIILEDKKSMKKRGLTSPDIADAVVLAFVEDYVDPWMDFLRSASQGVTSDVTPTFPELRRLEG